MFPLETLQKLRFGFRFALPPDDALASEDLQQPSMEDACGLCAAAQSMVCARTRLPRSRDGARRAPDSSRRWVGASPRLPPAAAGAGSDRGLACCAQDDERWHRADSDRYESEGEGERYEFGQECLDRIALALGGNTIVPLASSLLVTLLQARGGPPPCPPPFSFVMRALSQLLLLVAPAAAGGSTLPGGAPGPKQTLFCTAQPRHSCSPDLAPCFAH